jgi:hypothetical protein
MIYLKVATAATVHIGPFVDSTDGFTAETGLDVTSATIRLSANGGAWGAADASATHSSNGYYTAVLDATDTATLGRLNLACNITGALPVFQTYHVIQAHVFDTLFSTDTFNVNVAEWASSATATGTFANTAPSTSDPQIGVNLVNIAGSAVSTGAGQLGVNVFELGGTAVTGRDIGANVLLSAGTGTGEITLTSGRVSVATGTSSGQINLDAGKVYVSSGTGAGQFSFSSGGIPLVNISSGTGAGQLINTDGVVTANVTFWNSTAVAANSLANLTALASGNFTTGTREYLWTSPGADSGITHSVMLDRVYSHFFNKMTITDASGEIVLRNAADDGDLGTATITDDDTDTVRSSMTFP